MFDLENIYNKNLINGIKEKNFETVKDSIKNGASLNGNIGDKFLTPLLLCLKNPDVKIFKYMVSKGADVNERIGYLDAEEWDKISLLQYAVDIKEMPIDIIETIIENGGYRDINYAPKGTKSPAEIAIENNSVLLLENFKKYTDLRVNNEQINISKNI